MAEKKNKIKKVKVTDIIKPSAVRAKKTEKRGELDKEEVPQKPVIISRDEPNISDDRVLKRTEKEESRLRKAIGMDSEGVKKIGKQAEDFELKEIKRFTEEEKKKRKKRFNIKTYALFTILILFFGAAAYAAAEYLPKAKIKITTKKVEWQYNDSILATKKISAVDFGNKYIPAETFSKRKNFSYSFPATDKKPVPVKINATGKIIIHNDSSLPQTLIATTRFETPDGKIFKLDRDTRIPTSSIGIEASVTADKAGPAYNIGPVAKFTLPKFKEIKSEKYYSFYGESKEPMKGGFIGEQAYPNDSDVKKAQEQAKKMLEQSIDSLLVIDISGFKFIDGSKQFNILKPEEVNKNVDEKNNFSVFLDAETSVVGFKEDDLLALMENLANNDLKQQGSNFKISSYSLEYGSGRPDFKEGSVAFALNFKGQFSEPVNQDEFKGKALNKNSRELKQLISSFPGIEKITLSFWPFWVQRVPNDLGRVTTEVE